MSPLVKIQNLSYTYHTPKGETKTLENINLMINKGEFISIVGPSGCGKSTLLSLISGLIQPSIGEVVLDKSLINNDSHYIGYMLQKDHLFEWRTVYRNVLLGLEINNKQSKESLEYINGLLKQYGLYDFKNYKPSQLSGGMRQKAALIRTLALKPEILLLDEPFAALDYQTRLSAGDEIGTILKEENKTALLVTHDIADAICNKKLLYILIENIYTPFQ
ncbi:ABC transporter ATP-binding protein [Vallitalea sediminicola]